VKIIPLIENDLVLRSSLWARPDLPYITEEEFKKLFPYDEFRDESNPEKLKQGEPVFTQNFDTRVNDTIEFRSMKNWKPGRYVLSITSTDAFGETVSAMTYFTLLDKTGTEAPLNEIWSFNPLKTNCEPGQHAEFLISSGAENLQVLYEIEYKGKIVQREFITLNRSQKLISIPVEESTAGTSMCILLLCVSVVLSEAPGRSMFLIPTRNWILPSKRSETNYCRDKRKNGGSGSRVLRVKKWLPRC